MSKPTGEEHGIHDIVEEGREAICRTQLLRERKVVFGVWVFLSVLDEIFARELRGNLGDEEKKLDELLVRFLPILARFLPLPTSTSGRTLVPLTFFDRNRPAELFALYRCSSFLLAHIQILVGKASLGDYVERFEVLITVLDFLKALTDYGMVSLITERWDWKGKGPGLGLLEKQFISDGRTGETLFEVEKGEKANSIAVACNGLFKQAAACFELGEKQGISFDVSNSSNQKGETPSFWYTTPKTCQAILKLKKNLVEKSPETLHVLKSPSEDPWATFCTKNNVFFSNTVSNDHYFMDKFAKEGVSLRVIRRYLQGIHKAGYWTRKRHVCQNRERDQML